MMVYLPGPPIFALAQERRVIEIYLKSKTVVLPRGVNSKIVELEPLIVAST